MQDSLLKLGDRLFQSIGGDKVMAPIMGAGHNDLFMYEDTYRVIREFLRKI